MEGNLAVVEHPEAETPAWESLGEVHQSEILDYYPVEQNLEQEASADKSVPPSWPRFHERSWVGQAAQFEQADSAIIQLTVAKMEPEAASVAEEKAAELEDLQTESLFL